MNASVEVEMKYKCGHSKVKQELIHEGHDVQHKLDWFKENVVCVDCSLIEKGE